MKKLQFEIKSLDDALKYASKELKINKEVIEINVLETKSVLGFKKSYKVEAIVNVDPAEIGYKTLKELFDNMLLDAQIELTRGNEKEVTYSINTSEKLSRIFNSI